MLAHFCVSTAAAGNQQIVWVYCARESPCGPSGSQAGEDEDDFRCSGIRRRVDGSQCFAGK